MDATGVTLGYTDYRDHDLPKVLRLEGEEFVRRFLLHVLPSGFHRIRHYGLLANAGRREHLARARELLQVSAAAVPAGTGTDDPTKPAPPEPVTPTYGCPDCGALMQVLDTLLPSPHIRAPPPAQAAA